MSTHLRLHRLGGMILAASCLFALACGGARPHVNVLGVSEARTSSRLQKTKLLVVFVEVVNPMSRDLELSHLEYDLQSPSWIRTHGNVRLGRSVSAGSSMVVEIPVPVDQGSSASIQGAQYELQGRLFARDSSRERSWTIRVKGALSKSASNRVRIQIADSN